MRAQRIQFRFGVANIPQIHNLIYVLLLVLLVLEKHEPKPKKKKQTNKGTRKQIKYQRNKTNEPCRNRQLPK